MSIIRPFLKKEVAKLLHVHKAGSETLFDFVPRELLPIEYGGTNGSIKELKVEWKKRLESHRDYLMDESNWLLKDMNDNNTLSSPKAEIEQMESRFEKIEFD